MKADTALVRSDGVAVLHAPAALNPNVAAVIFPAHPEADDSIRLGDAPKDLILVIFLLVLDEVEDVLCNLLNCFVVFRLAGVARANALHELLEIHMVGDCHPWCLSSKWLNRAS